MRCEALQNRTSSAGACACAVASASQAALGPAVAQIGTASPSTAGSSPRGDDMPSQAAPRQKNERVLLPSDPGAKGPRGARPAARPPGAGGGEAVEASRPARRCGGVANGGGAHPRDAQYCKRLLLGAYTSSLIRTADSRARRTWCFRPGSRARGGAVVGARELEGTTMCLYWAGAYWVSAVRTAQTPVHLAWRCLAGWLLGRNLTCTSRFLSVQGRGIPGTLRLERPNSATRSRSTQRVTPECRFFVGRGPTRGRGAAPKSIITHVPTGPRDQIILFIRAPLEDRNLPPHQEKPRAHPRPPSEGRSPGERRSAGER